jgi:hypothetical protein
MLCFSTEWFSPQSLYNMLMQHFVPARAVVGTFVQLHCHPQEAASAAEPEDISVTAKLSRALHHGYKLVQSTDGTDGAVNVKTTATQ